MSDISIILNNQLEVPLSKAQIQNLELDFSFNNFSPNLTLLEDFIVNLIKTNKANDGVEFVKDWINTNLLTTGIPAKIFDTSSGVEILDGLLDLTSDSNKYDDQLCEYNIQFKQFNNNFFDNAEGVNMQDFFGNSNIPINFQFQRTDFEQIRYVLSQVPNTSESVSTFITLYLISKEVTEMIAKVAEMITKLAGIAGFTVGALGATAWLVAEIIFNIAYIVLVATAIYKLLEQLSDLLFQKPKAYYCFNVKTAIKKVCAYLGYTLETDLFDGDYEKLTYLASTVEEGALFTQPTNNPLPNKSFLQFLQDIGVLFNAKIKVLPNNVIEFRNKFDYIGSPSDVEIRELKNEGGYKFNTSELAGLFTYKFLKDPIETNTYLRVGLLGIDLNNSADLTTEGNELSVSYEVNGISKQLNLLTDKIEVNFPFSRAYRKNYERDIEKLFNSIYDAVNALKSISFSGIVKGGNGNTNVTNTGNKVNFGSRIGYMMLNSDLVGNDKIFILGDNERIDEKSFELIHCEALHDRFYAQEGIDQNQWLIKDNRSEQPICSPTEVAQLRTNNIAKDEDGNTILIESNKRNAFTGLHVLQYRRRLKSGDFGFIEPENITITKNKTFID